MDFAKKQLEKYGWQEGKGLGRNEDGISSAIKPKLKFDTAGVGHSYSEQFTNSWWENLYNSAASNVNVTTASGGKVRMSVKDPESVDITNKSYSAKNFKKSNDGLEYGSFVKTSKLTQDGVVHFDTSKQDDENCALPKLGPGLTDEELFTACGGRTAHKGARHGLTLNGKLSRLEKQEKLLLKKLKKVSLSEEPSSKTSRKSIEKKLKKIHKSKPDFMEDDSSILSSGGQFPSFSSPQKTKKRRKEHKRVSFSETVTEYQSLSEPNQPHDVDSSSMSDTSSRPSTPVTIKKVKIKEEEENANLSPATTNPDQDEGIDCSFVDSIKEKDSELQVKIKEDNKLMKRNLKKLRKKGYSDLEKNLEDESEKYIKSKKRKNEMDIDGFMSKKCYWKELDETLSKKKLKKLRKQERLERRINRVADSLDHFSLSKE